MAGMEGLTAQVRRVADVLAEREVPRRRGPDPMPLGGGSGTRLLLTSMPAFVALWRTRVPDEHVEVDRPAGVARVSCPCGQTHVLPLDEAVLEAAEGCGRWWLATVAGVRVHRPVGA